MGNKGDLNMYHYVEDKEFVCKMRILGGNIMQELCHCLKTDYCISANFFLVGSGKRNLIMQNGNGKVDLDYNLEIIKPSDLKERALKTNIIKAFNTVLRNRDLDDCKDSKSVITTGGIVFKNGNDTVFTLDVCIVTKDERGKYRRLIHEKTGFSYYDKYYWNEAPFSGDYKKRVDYIKKNGKWDLLREQYKRIKNKYLCQNDNNHPSFVCYLEAVNNVYSSLLKNK